MKKIKILFLFALHIACNYSDKDLIQKAKEIHQKVTILDTHDDIDVNNFTSEKNYSQNLNTKVNIPKMERGWQDASETFNVTLELVKRGYTEEEISKIWSGNLLRVLDEVQEISLQLQNLN